MRKLGLAGEYKPLGRCMPTSQHAIRYADNGCAVFPLWGIVDGACQCPDGNGCRTPGSHQQDYRGMTDATKDRSKIQSLWGGRLGKGHNIAIATGKASQIAVVRINLRHPQAATQSIDGYPDLPAGPRVEVESGVFDCYFDHPGRKRLRKPLRNPPRSPEISVFSNGKFVLAPPSQTLTGTLAWTCQADVLLLPPLPTEWVNALVPPDWCFGKQVLAVSEVSPSIESIETYSKYRKVSQRFFSDEKEEIAFWHAVELTVPTDAGERYLGLRDLCRYLRALPTIKDSEAQLLLPLVGLWHAVGSPFTKDDFGVTAKEFPGLFEKCNFPYGFGLGEIWPPIADAPAPPELLRLVGHRQHTKARLAALCRELWRRRGTSDRFTLAIEPAAEVMHSTASFVSKWLGELQKEGIIRVVQKGSKVARRATTYAYIGPGHDDPVYAPN